MDIFGERIVRNEEKKIEYENRIREIKELSEAIPSAVTTVYVPSGKTEPNAVPKFLIAGLGGASCGIIASAIIIFLSVMVFQIFESVGRCLIILYYPAVLFYYFGPVLIGAFAGLFVGLAGTWAKSRKPSQAGWAAFFWGLLAAIGSVFIESWLIENANVWWNVRDCLCGDALSPDLMEGFVGVVVTGIIALLNMIFAPFIASSVIGDQKFCETCKEYLKDEVISRVSLDNTNDLLLGLLEGEKKYLLKLKVLPEKEKWGPKDERLDITHSKCSCDNTNFIEVTAYWKKAKEKKEKDQSTGSRLIYSGEFTQNQVEKLKEYLNKDN